MRFSTLIMMCLGSAAAAQDGPAGIAFTFGLGAESKPGYFGADETVTGLTGSFSLDRFRWGSIGIGEGPDRDGLGFSGSFRFIGAREAEEFEELAPYEDIEAAFEVGGGLKYTTQHTESFAVVRRGFGGHEGYVAELGGDLIFYPSQTVTVRAGPRLLAGDDAYADTYFGETFADPTQTGGYAASGGVLSRGVEVSADYALNPEWGITGTLRYDQLLNDAAASPITQSTDQVSASIVVKRDFTFGF